MEQLVQQMIDNLERTICLYQQILECEREKRRAIAQSRLGALTAIVAREEELVARAGELEAQRLTLRNELAAADARLDASARLHHLIEILGGPQRDLLADKRRDLLALAEQINEVNRLNFQRLREIFDDARGGPPPPSTYDPDAEQERPACDAIQTDQAP